MLGVSIFGTTKLRLGLDLTEVVKKSAPAYSFLETQEKYFGIDFLMAAFKEEADFPRQQHLVQQFITDLKKSKYVIAPKPGTWGDSWQVMFARYLTELQKTYDMNKAKILREIPEDSAPDDAKLAHKMICNSGHGVDCHRNVKGIKLIVDGKVNEQGYYKYVTVWFAEDISSKLSFANFFPPPPTWNNKRNKTKQIIPAAYPPLYSQMMFLLSGLTDANEIVAAIKEVRKICEKYTDEHGLPVYPSSIYFNYFELYVELLKSLLISLGVTVGCVFLVMSVLLLAPWTAVLITMAVVLNVVEVIGFMGLVGLHLNPISAVILIAAVGIGVEFTVHMGLSFLTNMGSFDERMVASLEHMFVPVTHGGMSTLLGIVMLGFSEYTFILRYVFMLLSVLVVLGLINGLCVLPVILSLIGPQTEIWDVKLRPNVIRVTSLGQVDAAGIQSRSVTPIT